MMCFAVNIITLCSCIQRSVSLVAYTLHMYFILMQLLNITIACDGTSVLALDLGEKYWLPWGICVQPFVCMLLQKVRYVYDKYMSKSGSRHWQFQ